MMNQNGGWMYRLVGRRDVDVADRHPHRGPARRLDRPAVPEDVGADAR